MVGVYKYTYMGDAPQVLMEQHKEVSKGDIVELDEPIDNINYVLIPEEAVQEVTVEPAKETKKKPKDGEVN